jgi:hypothetical protein
MREIIKHILKKVGLFNMAKALKQKIVLFGNRRLKWLIFSYNYVWGVLNRSLRYVYSYFLFYVKIKSNLKIEDHKKIISLLCPTRGRPEKAMRFIKSVRRTAAIPERIELLFYIDSDDERKNYYLTLFNKAKAGFKRLLRCEAFVGEPISISKSINILAERCQGDLVVPATDDQVYVDYAWDVRLDGEAAKIPDQIFCFCFNDGSHRSPDGAFPIVSRKWIETLGYFASGIFKFAMNDTWVIDVAKSINRFYYFSDILVEHLHWVFNKSLNDNTYRRNRRKEIFAWDSQLFIKTAPERRKAAEKLQRVINGFWEDHSS